MNISFKLAQSQETTHSATSTSVFFPATEKGRQARGKWKGEASKQNRSARIVLAITTSIIGVWNCQQYHGRTSTAGSCRWWAEGDEEEKEKRNERRSRPQENGGERKGESE
jgi:hypothetical protein